MLASAVSCWRRGCFALNSFDRISRSFFDPPDDSLPIRLSDPILPPSQTFSFRTDRAGQSSLLYPTIEQPLSDAVCVKTISGPYCATIFKLSSLSSLIPTASAASTECTIRASQQGFLHQYQSFCVLELSPPVHRPDRKLLRVPRTHKSVDEEQQACDCPLPTAQPLGSGEVWAVHHWPAH